MQNNFDFRKKFSFEVNIAFCDATNFQREAEEYKYFQSTDVPETKMRHRCFIVALQENIIIQVILKNLDSFGVTASLLISYRYLCLMCLRRK